MIAAHHCIHGSKLANFCFLRLFDQALNNALGELYFAPDVNSNAINTDDLASITFIVNDLGFSGGGGSQDSEPITVSINFRAVNDGPLLNLPGSLAAQEDVPLLISGLSVLDTDSEEPGGVAAETLQKITETPVFP